MTQHPQFSLLTMLDAVRSPDTFPFAADPQATALERRARELADEFWPDQLWLTGSISPALLDAVARRLEAERDALHDRIHVLVVTERRSTPQA